MKEESKGKSLHLQQFFEEYRSLKKVMKALPIDEYLFYVREFDKFEKIPAYVKQDKYAAYVKNLADYLQQFLIKARPLENFTRWMAEI